MGEVLRPADGGAQDDGCLAGTADCEGERVEVQDEPDSAEHGGSVEGRVIDTEGEAVPDTFLVLCGTVDGKDTCTQGNGTADGTFEYTGLHPGYTHMQILTFAAEKKTGKRYGGANVLTPVETEETHLDLGDVKIPVVEQVTEIVVAAGGSISEGGLEVVLAPGALVFPDAGESGSAAVQPVGIDDVPFSYPGMLAAFAIYPFASMVIDGALVRIHLDETGLTGHAPDDLIVLHNPMLSGGLEPLEHTVDGFVLEATIPDLTWVVLASEGTN